MIPKIFLVIVFIAFLPVLASAKEGDEQSQIILLNDSAAALEDSDHQLSHDLTKFADEKENEFENKNANRDQPPPLSAEENLKIQQDHIRLLRAAAAAIQPSYPLIAKGLVKMAYDINRTIELQRSSEDH